MPSSVLLALTVQVEGERKKTPPAHHADGGSLALDRECKRESDRESAPECAAAATSPASALPASSAFGSLATAPVATALALTRPAPVPEPASVVDISSICAANP
jgi:hypothetical protein